MVDAVALAPEFALILVTATVLGYIARLTGQPTLIAYIFTGLILGPVFLDVITQTELVDLMAELGLGFLLFLLGMEMKLDKIRDILRSITNIAIWQTVLQTALAFGVALLLQFTLVQSVIIALATVFGATPVIVKVLTDKDEITTLPGRIDVGVLILQDIYLVIILALLSAESLANPVDIATSIVTVLVMMSFIAVFALTSSRYLLPPLFNRVAQNTDAFFIVGLAWAFLFIAASEGLDLSLEVGAFLAGVSLAQLPYSTELEQRIQPITDFFMVIFFASIGLIIAADDLLAYWSEAVIASALLMVGNFLIMFYLIDRENFTPETSFLGSINMVQVSEFSLVVGALAVTQGYVGTDILGYLSLMAILTMTLSTYLITYNHALYRRAEPYLARFESDEKRDVALREYRDHAVVVGYDELSREVLPVLREHFDQVVVVDRDPGNTDMLEAAEDEYIYGDFKYGEIRAAAALGRAAFVLSSSVQRDVNERILHETRDDATVFVEADGREDAIGLYDAGADYVILADVLTGERINEHLKLYLYDAEFFAELARPRLEEICRRTSESERVSRGDPDV